MGFGRVRVTGGAGGDDRAVADQIANIGHRPIGAGFDEPIGILLINIGFDDINLFPDQCQQRAQGKTDLGIARPVECRKQIIDFVRGGGHAVTSCRISVSGTSGVR